MLSDCDAENGTIIPTRRLEKGTIIPNQEKGTNIPYDQQEKSSIFPNDQASAIKVPSSKKISSEVAADNQV